MCADQQELTPFQSSTLPHPLVLSGVQRTCSFCLQHPALAPCQPPECRPCFFCTFLTRQGSEPQSGLVTHL